MSRVRRINFTRDRDLIMWKETLLYNGMRAVAAGLVFGTIALFAGEPAGEVLPVMFGYPLVYYFFLLPFGIVLSLLSSIPMVGLFAAFVGLLVAIGDPFVFIFSKFKPELVPVERPAFFSIRVIEFVLLPFDE